MDFSGIDFNFLKYVFICIYLVALGLSYGRRTFTVVHGLQKWAVCRLSFSMACGIFVLQPGIEPASPALQSGSLAAGLPGNSLTLLFFQYCIKIEFV